MSPDEIRVASVARYRQAKDAVKSGDTDKALELLGQALELAPESAQVRRTLRDVQCQAIPPGNIPTKLAKLKLVKLKAQIKVMDAAGDWEGLIRTAEEAATIDPWDIEINAATAAACLGLDYKPAAFLFYQRVSEQEPTNTKFLRRCASMLESTGQDEKAFEYWQRVNKVDPNDSLAKKRVKEGRALGFHQPKQAGPDRDDIAEAATKYLESDTILDEGDTAHGEQAVPPMSSATPADSGLDPDSGLSADSGLDPDSGMSSVPKAPTQDAAPAGPSGPPQKRTGPVEPPGAAIGPSGPPKAPASGGPSGPPQKTGPGGPPRKGPAAAPRTPAASSTGPAGPPGQGPSVPPASGPSQAAAGPSAAPSGAGPSSGPRFSQTDLMPGGGPSAPPAPASAPPRGTRPSTKAFALPIPPDMPDHVQNLLTVASSLVARDRADEACTVLEKALTIAEGDDWIEGMLLALKRKPR